MSSRLQAIQTIATLVNRGNQSEADEDRAAELLCVSLFSLGVTLDEIRDAMSFVLITGGTE